VGGPGISRQHLELPDKPSIVVLPFDNISAEPGQDYLADGIVEAITAALSRIRSFFVIARQSAFTYKGRAANVRDIGKELGVAYVLEGSVQKGGNRLRITAQLVETEAGSHVWSSRYDGTMDDIFDLQDRITEQLAGAIQPSIRIAEIERSQRKRPQDLSCYDYTMQAMPHVWVLEKEESTKALDLLEKALAIDPNYPLALSLAGWCHAQRSVYNFVEDIAGSQAKARALAERAAELGGDIRSSWRCLGRYTPSSATLAPRASCWSALSRSIPMPLGHGTGSAGSRIIRNGLARRSATSSVRFVSARSIR
jgi:adenylate cyclase